MSSILILAIIVLVVLFSVQGTLKNSRDLERFIPTVKLLKIISIIVIAITLLGSMLFVVQPGFVSIEVLLGKTMKYAGSGLHFKSPISTIVPFDIRTVKDEYKSEGTSQDLQLIIVESAINYRIDPKKIPELFNTVGRDYVRKVLDPAVHESIKAGTSKFKVEDIIVKRTELKEMIANSLRAKMTNYHIFIEEVNLVDIDFSAEFNKVVEEKQIEEQRIKTAEYRKQQAEQDKQRVILEAQGESEKQRLLRSTTSKEVIELKWIEKWNGQLPVTMLGDSKGIIMNLNK